MNAVGCVRLARVERKRGASVHGPSECCKSPPRAASFGMPKEDLARTYLHIGSDSPSAAEHLLDTVEHAIAVLSSQPRAGRPREFRPARAHGMRSWVVRGFEHYLIFYRPQQNGIEVVRFVHGTRDLPSLLDDEP